MVAQPNVMKAFAPDCYVALTWHETSPLMCLILPDENYLTFIALLAHVKRLDSRKVPSAYKVLPRQVCSLKVSGT